MIIYYQCLLLVLAWLLALLWGVRWCLWTSFLLNWCCMMLHVSNKLSNKTWPNREQKTSTGGPGGARSTSQQLRTSLHFLRLMARFASRSPTQKPQIWVEVVFKRRCRKSGWSMESQFPKKQKSNFWCIPHFWANSGKQSRNATFEALRWVRNPYSFRSVSRPILTLCFRLVSSILQPQTILLEREKNIRIIRKTKTWVCPKRGIPKMGRSFSLVKLPEIGCHVPPFLDKAVAHPASSHPRRVSAWHISWHSAPWLVPESVPARPAPGFASGNPPWFCGFYTLHWRWEEGLKVW